MEASQPRRVIIVGAGFTGLVAAKTYLQINPAADITIIDKEDGIGGVWSASRIYPGLTYEVPTPLLNFTDFDMCKELGKEMWEDVSGYEVNEFLVKYAEKHNLTKLCRLSTEVLKIERDGRGWKVLVRPVDQPNASPESLFCEKLIMATGITSVPRTPHWDMTKFDGFHFHAKQMGKRHKELVSEDVKNVTIIGGHKSALEAVGTCAQAGKSVEWLVKADGGGPTWLMPAKNPNGSSLAKMSTVRMMAALSPSVYRKPNWLDRFLHSQRWWLGNWLLTSFWTFMTKTIKGDRYNKSPNMKKLEPHPKSMFWFVPGGTIVHDRDAETIRLIDEEKFVHVNRAELVSAQGRTVTLSSGKTIPCDGIIFCIGWELSIPPLFPPPLANDLGLPVDFSIPSTQENEYWEALDTTSESDVLARYPILRNPPSEIHVPKSTLTPYRHFRSMIPPKLAARNDNSLVFIGNWANGRVQITAELASLYAIAYLENLMPPSTQALLSDEEAMNRDIAHVDAFRRKRYLNCFPFRISIFDTPEFDDALMRDLGLRADRKRMRMRGGWRDCWVLKAWCREWFEGYFASDYAGIVEEFLEGVERRKEGKVL
ncbi:FAD/NAD(P)-binding domain-containing protein [Mollisia scopiformis]|uniref:FAD/NAD(P)-binding domain-containing protein n=1 Tax=Mollisia scopiformis TaxID=149040 RepID=A0A194XW12_MOLSC|nr:FAD/NAD(P)-binding domain-containing protein [Mollisia scopiformis]KUJ24500.1 FAD/NAD(P)-binding domain-containing protein [Mollisia scopiformis]